MSIRGVECGHFFKCSGGLPNTDVRTPVTHLEPVRAFMSKPKPGSAAQQSVQYERDVELLDKVDIWMEHVDGRVVLEGTASAGLKPG
eukprot:1955739-Amphidinium_carterae.1